MHGWLFCKWASRGWITVVPCPVQMAWHTAYSALYTCLQDTFSLESIENRGGGGWGSNSENLLQRAGYLLPSMRKKKHFSSFLVHWLGPGGKTLRVRCRTSFRSSLFSMCSLGPTQKDEQMLCRSKTEMKKKMVEWFSLQVDIYWCYGFTKICSISGDQGLKSA